MTPVERLIAHDSALLRCELHHGHRRRRGRIRAAMAARLLRVVPVGRWKP